MKIQAEDFFQLAIEAGFDDDIGIGLSGSGELDRRVYCAEYPVGESLVKFAKALLHCEGIALEVV